jgi:hypothetical protein
LEMNVRSMRSVFSTVPHFVPGDLTSAFVID